MLVSRVSRFYAFFLILLIVAPAHAASTQRSYVSGKFALFLNGSFVGVVSKVSGGFAEGAVVEELPPTDYYVQKHLDYPPDFQDITITAGTGMQAAFYQWIKNTIEGNFSRTTDGKIVAYDSTNKPIRTLEFYDAQITEVTFPRLDASSKEAAAMTVQITPSATWSSSGGDPFPGTVSKTQKKWLASNFRLAIDGVDMTRASSVEALRVAIPLGYPPGTVCIICPPPLAINFPNVEVRLASSFASSAIKWYEESVYNGFAEEKNGAIEYLTSDAKGVLFRLTLHNLGPISIENDDGGSIAATILRMYAEHMKFEIATGVN